MKENAQKCNQKDAVNKKKDYSKLAKQVRRTNSYQLLVRFAIDSGHYVLVHTKQSQNHIDSYAPGSGYPEANYSKNYGETEYRVKIDNTFSGGWDHDQLTAFKKAVLVANGEI